MEDILNDPCDTRRVLVEVERVDRQGIEGA